MDIHFSIDRRELFSVKRDVHQNDRREKFTFQFQGIVPGKKVAAPVRDMYRNKFRQDLKDRAQRGSHVTRHVGTDMERVSMVKAKRAQMTHG